MLSLEAEIKVAMWENWQAFPACAFVKENR